MAFKGVKIPSATASTDDFDPSKLATLKLWGHIFQKGWQAGSFLGVAAVAPGLQAYSIFLKDGTLNALTATEGAAYGALAGLALTGVVGSLKFLQMDREGVNDRVYRLHYNQSQHRTDLFAGVGGAVGLAAAAILLPKVSDSPPQPLNLLGGAAVGTVAGMLLHMVSRPAEYTSPSKMLHELRH